MCQERNLLHLQNSHCFPPNLAHVRCFLSKAQENYGTEGKPYLTPKTGDLKFPTETSQFSFKLIPIDKSLAPKNHKLSVLQKKKNCN